MLPDHLQLVVSATPPWAPHQRGARFTGTASRILRQAVPLLRRLPSRWTRSLVVSPAGTVAADTIQRSIDAQSTRDV
ncbi:MAG: transposase [Chloroflexus sp.]|uniref:transposase n=1 Tax=Chloroflexus sp. TaxID=1904827 RepID=UPI00404B842E